MNDHQAPELVAPVSTDDHLQGHACGMAYPEVKRIQREFGSALCFVFRNFPLSEAHPLARPAAEVAEAAALQRQFWPMHDWLYENQDEWTTYGAEGLETGLRAVGVDETAAARAIRNTGIDQRIRSDFMGGVRSGVNGTPGFFLNGYRCEGDFRSLAGLIAELIEGT